MLSLENVVCHGNAGAFGLALQEAYPSATILSPVTMAGVPSPPSHLQFLHIRSTYANVFMHYFLTAESLVHRVSYEGILHLGAGLSLRSQVPSLQGAWLLTACDSSAAPSARWGPRADPPLLQAGSSGRAHSGLPVWEAHAPQEKVWEFLVKLNTHLPWGLVVPFQGIHLREKTICSLKICHKKVQISFIHINQNGSSPRSHQQTSNSPDECESHS